MTNAERPPSSDDKPETERAKDAIDDAWVKPLIDEALRSLDRGEGTPWRKGEALERIMKR